MNYVRLRPYNPRKGHLLRVYVHRSHKFVHGKWYEVSDAMGEELSMVVSRQDDEDSPLAFDIFETKEDAQDLLRAERIEREKAKANVDDPEVVGVLTTSDLNDDEAAQAARAKRAAENLERAKAKRAEEKEKAERKAKREQRKAATTSRKDGGDTPADAQSVDDGKDPFE